ncbi:fatty-acyl-CoA synthase [Angomonas deanei]|uniref:AMP-binding enzyme/AMP-binding enzyme C-terminal domain containing protein, putative n=1 Tax=Angomonas deanei TaxID=59799 RepID=A0A7G2C4Q7_9TRYP|nr:fatty-acyl-CoA synthase [Angomonas deanei]CAD2213713.1 AMP-binding enzyme/AMP-binding enzyme C-terminal domain containing protein, putative [Angomonas deanei]|eukprot:EPY19285.1 fatty-acyl-CoA synthase [Angomonas deanei]
MHYTEKDRVCIPVPFFHCFGIVAGNLGCTTHGSCIVIPHESFDPGLTLQAVQDEKCTSLYGVPTMFIAELRHPNFNNFDLSSLRTGVMGATVCPADVMKQVQTKMYMKEITICFGMTETSPTATQTTIGTPFEKQMTTVGTVQDHLEIKIVDPQTGDVVPIGQEGEVCTRGYSVMLKYWDAPEATSSVIDAARWMHTGDKGSMDEEGYLTCTGRIKDIIIRGGENISPKEVEEYLYGHERISEVQVIGVPDERLGEEVMAWVKLVDGCTATEEELKNFCKGQISHYKVPRYWKFVKEFPTTLSGKIRKIEMREVSAKELGLEHLIAAKEEKETSRNDEETSGKRVREETNEDEAAGKKSKIE